MPPLVWLIEDRADTADPLIYTLETEGFNVCWFNHIQPTLDALRQQTPQLAVIQLTLPDGCGLALGHTLQEQHPDLPLLFLAPDAAGLARVSEASLPYTDAIARPYSAREICVRMRTLLQHPEKCAARATRLECYGNFTLNDNRRCAHYCGHALQLTSDEYLLLKTLLQGQGKLYTRHQLGDVLHSLNEKNNERSVERPIRTLRAKLQRITPHDMPLNTHHGVGFSID